MKSFQVPKAVLLAVVLLGLGLACGTPASPEISGAEIYYDFCASCHGAQGEGQPGWQIKRDDGTYPAPPHDSTGHTWHHSDGYLFRVVKEGGASLNIPNYTSTMPSFGRQLSDAEIRAVINHLKTLWQAGQRESQSLASEADPYPE